jgi:hypothetical protein
MNPTERLEPEELLDADRLAESRAARWKGHRGRYGNSLRNHRVGALGEIAAEKWAKSHGWDVSPLFKDSVKSGSADLVVNGIRIEVKTWSSENWEAWGRCFSTEQAQTLSTKADLVVWCIAADGDITLAGWSTPEDVLLAPVRVTGPPYRRIENHQLDVGDLRRIEDLEPLLSAGNRSSA